MFRWLSPAAGAALIVVALADVFLTVLYARIGFAFLTEAMGAWMWSGFKRVAPIFPRYRDTILSFCGPFVLVAAVTIWTAMLMCGFALVVWPKLGTSVISSHSPTTPTDFWTVLYYSGTSMSTAGNGDLVPETPFFKFVAAVEPVIGISMLTLTLTYFLEVFNAVLRRNTLAQTLHHATCGTGDAADWIAGLGAGGDFAEARGELGNFVQGVLGFYESQHLYPVLIYFRFGEARYAIARKTLILFDAVSLIRTALDPDRYAGFIESSSVNQLWNGAMQLMSMMSRVFLAKNAREEDGAEMDEAAARRWRGRFRRATDRLRAAGVATAPDEGAATERYVALRRQWHGYVVAFAGYMQRSMDEIEPPDEDAD